MSLQVWLPLNGNLDNQGLGDITAITGTAGWLDNGKFGQGLNLKTDRVYLTCPQLKNLQTFSIAFWGYVDPSSSLTTDWQDLIGFTDVSSSGTSGTFRWETVYGNSNTSLYGIHWHDNATYAFVEGAHYHVNTRSTWCHCCVVFDNVAKKIYSYNNGVLANTHTHLNGRFNSSGQFYLGEKNNIEGRLNDVRIYDHALSAKEVKEISKGLCLHYKLSGIGGENLLQNSNNYGSGWSVNSICSKDQSNINFGTQTIHKQRSEQGTTIAWAETPTYWFYDSRLKPNTKYTFSVWTYTTNASLTNYNYNAIMCRLYDSSSTKILDASAGFKQLVNNQWVQQQLTFTTPSTQSAKGYFFHTCAYDIDCYFAGWKVEEGSIATPWCPNSADILYSELGLDSNIEYDCSGFGNDGIKSSTIIWSVDTPKYITSANYPDNASTISIGNFSQLVPSGDFTMNIWFKKETNSWSTKTWETIFGGPSGFELEAKLSSNNSPYIHPYSWGGGSTGSPNAYSILYELDKWNMLTMVRTTSNTQFYLNGELKVTGSAGSIPSGNYYFGSWRDATSQNFKGYLSDARIYATALSADDIKELYESKNYITNTGALMTQGEVIEQ